MNHVSGGSLFLFSLSSVQDDDCQEHDDSYKHAGVRHVEGGPPGHVDIQGPDRNIREIEIQKIHHHSPDHPVHDVANGPAEYEPHREARPLQVPGERKKDVQDDSQGQNGDDHEKRGLPGGLVVIKEPEGDPGIEDV